MRVTLALSDELTPALRAAVRRARLGPLLREGAARCGAPATAALAVRLTSDAELRALNARFRGVDEPTDVLAFPAGEAGHLGDLAISVERALAQRADGVAELRLLAVHGLLHLLGHDHAAAAAARRMTEATRRLLPGEAAPELVAAAAEPG